MLKRRKDGAASAALASFAELESGLDHLLGSIFDEAVRVRYHARPAPFDCSLPWIVAGTSEGDEVGLAIGSQVEPVEYFSQLVRVAASRRKDGAVLCLKRAWSKKPSHQHSFHAAACASASDPPIPIFLAAHEDSVLRAVWGREPTAARQSIPARCRAVLSMTLPAVDGATNFTGKADGTLRIAALRKQFQVRLCGHAKCIEALIESEDSMTDETTERGMPTCSFTLSLGEIELALDDALRLRSGMVIEFERPQVFDAQVLLNGAPWAAASVELEDRSIKLVIQKLIEEEKLTGQKQETSSSNARLLSETLSI